MSRNEPVKDSWDVRANYMVTYMVNLLVPCEESFKPSICARRVWWTYKWPGPALICRPKGRRLLS
ncbi:hypothetical protein LguiB_012670 [Lonicera macranthoides]